MLQSASKCDHMCPDHPAAWLVVGGGGGRGLAGGEVCRSWGPSLCFLLTCTHGGGTLPLPHLSQAAREHGRPAWSLILPPTQLAEGWGGSRQGDARPRHGRVACGVTQSFTLRGLGLILCWVNLKFVITYFIVIFEQRGSAFSFCPEPHKLCSWPRWRPALPTHPSLSGPSALHSHTQ